MTLRKIHVFRAGPQISSNGMEKTFTQKDLQEVVESYEPDVHEAPIVIGHSGDSDSAPAYGWVKGFEREGDDLYAKVDTTAPMDNLLKNKHYKKVSISLYSPKSKVNPHKGKWSARHLAMLGASPPAIKGLSDFGYSEAEILDFSMDLEDEDDSMKNFGPSFLDELSPGDLMKEAYQEHTGEKVTIKVSKSMKGEEEMADDNTMKSKEIDMAEHKDKHNPASSKEHHLTSEKKGDGKVWYAGEDGYMYTSEGDYPLYVKGEEEKRYTKMEEGVDFRDKKYYYKRGGRYRNFSELPESVSHEYGEQMTHTVEGVDYPAYYKEGKKYYPMVKEGKADYSDRCHYYKKKGKYVMFSCPENYAEKPGLNNIMPSDDPKAEEKRSQVANDNGDAEEARYETVGQGDSHHEETEGDNETAIQGKAPEIAGFQGETGSDGGDMEEARHRPTATKAKDHRRMVENSKGIVQPMETDLGMSAKLTAYSEDEMERPEEKGYPANPEEGRTPAPVADRGVESDSVTHATMEGTKTHFSEEDKPSEEVAKEDFYEHAVSSEMTGASRHENVVENITKEDHIKALMEELSSMKSDMLSIKEENQRLRSAANHAMKERRHSNVEKFINGLYESGKMYDAIATPEAISGYCEKLIAFDEGEEVEFSEDEPKLFDTFKKIMENLPVQVPYGEMKEEKVDFQEEDLDPHERALKRSKEEGIEYTEALKQELFSNK